MINVIAIDDEPLALKQLAYYLQKVPYFKLTACCQSAVEAMRVIGAQQVDVMFIDINMPDLNGLDFVRSLAHAPMVVFTTAYQEHAIDGYKVNAIDYLLKPFGMKDIMRAADKVKAQHDLLQAAAVSPIDESDALFVRAGYKVLRIKVADIVMVEGYGEYLRIWLDRQERPLTVYLSMRKMEERLNSRDFMRIHKSYIVSLDHIVEINKSRVALDNGADAPIGDNYKAALNNYVQMKFLGK